MDTLRDTVLRSFPLFGITLIAMEGLEQVEIFDFQLPRHGTFVWGKLQNHRNYSQLEGLVTVAMYQVTGLTCGFVYGMGLQPAGRIHNNSACDAHHVFFTCAPRTNPL